MLRCRGTPGLCGEVHTHARGAASELRRWTVGEATPASGRQAPSVSDPERTSTHHLSPLAATCPDRPTCWPAG